ncbi:HNH endonuclease, partial [Knoellia sp. CPCC 206435]
HVGVAKALVTELPMTMAALERGEISERRATIVVRETACLSRERRGEVDRRLAATIGSLGDKALAAAARRAGAALDSESLAERARRAVVSRRVSVRPAADGMAWGLAGRCPSAAVPSALAR